MAMSEAAQSERRLVLWETIISTGMATLITLGNVICHALLLHRCS